MLYWDGFEIDGSDTAFDLVLPEHLKTLEFVEYFLSLPVFAQETNIYYQQGREEVPVKREDIPDYLAREDRKELNIEVNCQGMDELPEEICRQLFSFSERREPHEEAYAKVVRPAMMPLRQIHYDRGVMTVALTIFPPWTKDCWYVSEERKLEGYVHNEALLRSQGWDCPCFSINVGPSFYYEYAMFIMESLRDRFPGLATTGGLDCAQGWTEGCTYASSIYAYEMITIPVPYNVKHTLKKLTECDLVRPYRQYYKAGWQCNYLEAFSLVNIPLEKWGSEYLLTFSEYAEHAQRLLAEQATGQIRIADVIYGTATNVTLPRPSRFAQKPEIQSQLAELTAGLSDREEFWPYWGYLCVTREEEKTVCQLRVHWPLKRYAERLWELAEAGELDYLKAEIYQRRHE